MLVCSYITPVGIMQIASYLTSQCRHAVITSRLWWGLIPHSVCYQGASDSLTWGVNAYPYAVFELEQDCAALLGTMHTSHPLNTGNRPISCQVLY